MNEYWKALKKNITPGILVMLAAGIILMVMSSRTEEEEGTADISIGYTSDVKEAADEDELTVPDENTELNSYYEKKLKQLLENTDGVGRACVMLSPDRDGVSILCEGAQDSAIRAEITSLVSAVFGIPAHKIQISTLAKE